MKKKKNPLKELSLLLENITDIFIPTECKMSLLCYIQLKLQKHVFGLISSC